MHALSSHTLINGVSSDQVSVQDRGLLYGDGVFRTLRLQDGCLHHWDRHYRKLQQDCSKLHIQCPEQKLLYEELLTLTKRGPNGIAKIIITRGQQTAHGYRPVQNLPPTRILKMVPLFSYPGRYASQGIKARICNLRLSHQPHLAGIKHLNRLENVLAAAECDDPDIAEGVLLDAYGNVIEGLRSNLFMVRDGELVTPALCNCGVAGVQRERVMEWADTYNVSCRVRQLGLAELLAADEIFLVNSVIGLWPVHELSGRRWNDHPISMQVQGWVNHAQD